MGGAISLSTLSADYTAQDGEILTGKLGATVTLKDATINGVKRSYDYEAEYSVGEGSYYFGERCRVTIGGVEGAVSDSTCIYP